MLIIPHLCLHFLSAEKSDMFVGENFMSFN